MARTSKANSDAPARTEGAAAETETKKGSSAPRARKYNYGITPEAKIKLIKKEEEVGTLRGDLHGDYVAATQSKTVEEYYAAGGQRSGLRRMMRREILQLTVGKETYPQDYVKPEAKEEAAA